MPHATEAPPACIVAVGTNWPGITWLKVIERIFGSSSGCEDDTDTHDEEPR